MRLRATVSYLRRDPHNLTLMLHQLRGSWLAASAPPAPLFAGINNMTRRRGDDLGQRSQRHDAFRERLPLKRPPVSGNLQQPLRCAAALHCCQAAGVNAP